MAILYSPPYVGRGKSLFPCTQQRLPKKCGSRRRSRTTSCVAALESGLSSAGAQLQVEFLQNMVTLGFPLSTDAAAAGENSIWWAVAAAPVALWYLSAAPGSLRGVVDYATTPVHSQSHKYFNAEEIEVGKQIGQGSFGIVYEGYIGRGSRKGSQQKEIHVILKKVRPNIRGAAVMHDAEVYMNRRVQRTAPNACAEFLGTTSVNRAQTRGRLTEGLWLIWRYEGGRTLDHYMKQRNFPENIAESLLGSKSVKEPALSQEENSKQNNAVIRQVVYQLLTNLRNLHKTGLVHRDVKPLNLILAEDKGTFKLIDLGACVDIRSGYNYVPEETIIDPTYAAPEHHVMPTSTPELPPDPLCSLISPLVWALNTPDRFDLYSAGLIMLQMSVKPLRHDMNLQLFNAEIKRAGYDLDRWRRRSRFNEEDFALLDADGGAGWELVKTMVQPRHDKHQSIWPSLGNSRPSAEAALSHRYFRGCVFKLPSFKALPAVQLNELTERNRVGRPPKQVVVSAALSNALPNSGTLSPELRSNFAQISSAISAATPTVSAALAGYLILSALRDSAQATYEFGQRATESLGISVTAFFAFFFLVKPWLEVQLNKHSINDDSAISWKRDQKARLTAKNGENSVRSAKDKILLSTQLQSSTKGQPPQRSLSEAVKEMELQLAVLEESMTVEKEYAQQQQQRVLQIQKLLRRSPANAAAPIKSGRL